MKILDIVVFHLMVRKPIRRYVLLRFLNDGISEYCKWKPELRDQMCVLFSDDDSDYSDDESSSYGRKRNSKHSTRQSATVSDSDDEIAAQIANYNKSDATAPKVRSLLLHDIALNY